MVEPVGCTRAAWARNARLHMASRWLIMAQILATACISVAVSSDVRTITLNNGQTLPLVGLGIGNLAHESIPEMVQTAVEDENVRLVDTAWAARNEHILGGPSLSPLFRQKQAEMDPVSVITKVWYTHLGYERTKLSVQESLLRLGRSSVDVVLLHWPYCRDDIPWMNCEEEEAALPAHVKEAGPAPARTSWIDSWRALEELQADGYVKSIGVSNFDHTELKTLLELPQLRSKPQILQGNIWSLIFDPSLMDFLKEHGIHFQAYNALNGVLPHLTPPHPNRVQVGTAAYDTLAQIGKDVADATGGTAAAPFTPAQVILQWLVQLDVSVIPRTSSKAHLHENSMVGRRGPGSFSLSEQQLSRTAIAVEAMLRAGADMEPAHGDEL